MIDKSLRAANKPSVPLMLLTGLDDKLPVGSGVSTVLGSSITPNNRSPAADAEEGLAAGGHR